MNDGRGLGNGVLDHLLRDLSLRGGGDGHNLALDVGTVLSMHAHFHLTDLVPLRGGLESVEGKLNVGSRLLNLCLGTRVVSDGDVCGGRRPGRLLLTVHPDVLTGKVRLGALPVKLAFDLADVDVDLGKGAALRLVIGRAQALVHALAALPVSGDSTVRIPGGRGSENRGEELHQKYLCI